MVQQDLLQVVLEARAVGVDDDGRVEARIANLVRAPRLVLHRCRHRTT